MSYFIGIVLRLLEKFGPACALLALVLIAAAHIFLVPIQAWPRWIAEGMAREDPEALIELASVPIDLGVPIIIQRDETKVVLSNSLTLSLTAISGDNPDVCTIATSASPNSDPLRLKRGQSEELRVDGNIFVITVQDCSFDNGTVTALLTWPGHPLLQR